MIDISFIHNRLEERGGAERKMLVLAKALEEIEEVNLTIYVHKFNPEKTFTELLEGLNIKEVGGSKLKFIEKVARLTKDSDIIHAHNHPAQFTTAISKILKKKPVVWFCNEPLLYLEETEVRQSRMKLIPLRMIEKFLLSWIDEVVANSRNTASLIESYMGRKPVIIYSGVDTKNLVPGDSDESDEMQAFLISRIEKEKNIEFVLDLAKAFEEVSFVIAGTGPDLERLREEAADKKIDNVNFVGEVSKEKKLELFQESSIFTMPTFNEPLGVTPIEAMSCKVPVVGFRSGGLKETIVDGETGFLADSEQDYKEKLTLLINNEKLRKKMGQRGRKRAEEKFSIAQMVDKTIKIYEKLLKDYDKDFKFN